jgi:hypothetical protein
MNCKFASTPNLLNVSPLGALVEHLEDIWEKPNSDRYNMLFLVDRMPYENNYELD